MNQPTFLIGLYIMSDINAAGFNTFNVLVRGQPVFAVVVCGCCSFLHTALRVRYVY